MRHRYPVFSLGSFRALHAEQTGLRLPPRLGSAVGGGRLNAGQQPVVVDIPGFKATDEGARLYRCLL